MIFGWTICPQFDCLHCSNCRMHASGYFIQIAMSLRLPLSDTVGSKLCYSHRDCYFSSFHSLLIWWCVRLCCSVCFTTPWVVKQTEQQRIDQDGLKPLEGGWVLPKWEPSRSFFCVEMDWSSVTFFRSHLCDKCVAFCTVRWWIWYGIVWINLKSM